MARLFGAHHVVDVTGEDPIEVVSGLTGGEMADVVIDVTGSPQGALFAALDLVRQGGTIVLAGHVRDDTGSPFLWTKSFSRRFGSRASTATI